MGGGSQRRAVAGSDLNAVVPVAYRYPRSRNGGPDIPDDDAAMREAQAAAIEGLREDMYMTAVGRA